MDASRIRKKKLRFHKFPDTCGRDLSFGGRQSNVSMTIVVFISCQFHSHVRSSLDQV